MGSVKIIINDRVEEDFRRAAMRRFGYGKGALSKAAEAALADWAKDESDPTGDLASDPVAAIEGLLKRTRKTSVELQHEAARIRVKRTLGKVPD
jgi:hypothetical protein